VVRRGKQACAIPVRTRPVLHHLFLLEFQGDSRKDSSRDLTITNTGNRAGAEIAEVYASLPAAAQEPPKRLVGFSKVKLNGGESKEISVEIDPKYLSIFSVDQNAWQLLPGDYTFMAGASSQDLPLKETVTLKD
jgi:beta-glucosidase